MNCKQQQTRFFLLNTMTLVHFCLFEKYALLEIVDEKNDNNIKKIDKIHLVIGNTFRQ